MYLDKTKLTLIIIAIACAILGLFISKMYVITPARCYFKLIPGENVSALGSNMFLLNVNRSLFNETLHIFTIKTFGPCMYTITPLVYLNLTYTTFNITFVINNETVVVPIRHLVNNYEMKVEPIEVGPNVTIAMYITTDAVYGKALIYVDVKVLNQGKS